MSERDMTVNFLGVELGKATGWDGDPGQTWWAYDFVPKDGVKLPACQCLQFDEDKGEITAQDNEGNTLQAFGITWMLDPR